MSINVKDGTPLEGESLCLTCAYAHIQRGFRESEEDVFCCYVQFRPVRFKVRECTAFCNRTLPTRYEMEKIALVIPGRQPASLPVFAARASRGDGPRQSERRKYSRVSSPTSEKRGLAIEAVSWSLSVFPSATGPFQANGPARLGRHA